MASKVKTPAQGIAERPRLLEYYESTVVGELKQKLGIKNSLAVPRVVSVYVNIGLGEALKNSSAVANASNDLAKITGQKPSVRRAKKSISNFGLREGQVVGLTVSLRRKRMWYFLDRFINITLPRIRDFRGLKKSGFDGNGNYTIGISEQAIFPEIDYNDIDKLRGLQVVIVTSATSDEAGLHLFQMLGMPFVDRRQNR